jgi:hypothetical protein
MPFSLLNQKALSLSNVKKWKRCSGALSPGDARFTPLGQCPPEVTDLCGRINDAD